MRVYANDKDEVLIETGDDEAVYIDAEVVERVTGKYGTYSLSACIEKFGFRELS